MREKESQNKIDVALRRVFKIFKLFSKKQQKLYAIFHLNKVGYKYTESNDLILSALKKKYSTADQIPLGLRKKY
jgi:hypothetical protein